MTQEDKAKAYDKLINDIKRIIFNHEGAKLYNLLDKQGEQKPEGKSALDGINEEKVNNTNIVDTDKIEPKFKDGDWIINKTNNSVCQIIGHENNTYHVKNYNCAYYQLIKVIDDRYRLWHITDAKDGDILVTGDGNIFIFKGIQDCTVYDYCGLYYGKVDIYSSQVNESCPTELPTNYTPAVKEQRDLLIKTLNDAGYDFDFEKKELKSIAKDKPIFKVGDWIVKNNTRVILLIKNKVGEYLTLEGIDGSIYSPCSAPSEDKYHLWSIYDAKPGDVIKGTNHTFMFFGIKQGIVQGLNIFIREKICEWGVANKDKYTPATKKESDAFKKQMIDAGYTYENLIFKIFK